MDNVNGKIKNNKLNEKKQTLDFIFNIDQKEVFDNELNCLKEDIESNNLDRLKIPAILNFISYKANQMKFEAKLAEDLKGTCNHSDIGEFLDKENYKMTKEHIDNYVRNNNLTTNLNDCQKNNEPNDYIAKEVNSKCNNELDNFLHINQTGEDNCGELRKMLDKPNLRKKSSNSNFPFHHSNENNFESECDKSNKNINIEKNTSVCQTVNNIHEKGMDHQKRKVVYELKILYLNGSENSAQFCDIEIDVNSDYNSFVQKLKKQLGIYEYSKFKILLLNQSTTIRRVYLEEISQLKKNGLNEIKIVPV